jgi:hypothetical protein
MFIMGCLPSSSTVAPHCYRVNSELYSKDVIERVWRDTGEALIEGVWRFTWRLYSIKFGDARGSRNGAS